MSNGYAGVHHGLSANESKFKVVSRDALVAPIEQDMLLGFDILYPRGKSILDMVKGTLTFDWQELSLDVGSSSGQAHVARVTAAKRHVIPPNCAVQLPCRLSQEMSDYVWLGVLVKSQSCAW